MPRSVYSCTIWPIWLLGQSSLSEVGQRQLCSAEIHAVSAGASVCKTSWSAKVGHLLTGHRFGSNQAADDTFRSLSRYRRPFDATRTVPVPGRYRDGSKGPWPHVNGQPTRSSGVHDREGIEATALRCERPNALSSGYES